MAERPGIMVYFDLLPQLEEYSPEEVGILFMAMLEFGAYGTIPTFEDRGMRIIWREVQGKIERDNAKYQQKVLDGAYGAYKREMEKIGREALPKQKWLEAQKEREVLGSIHVDTSQNMSCCEQLQQKQTTTTLSETSRKERETGTGGRRAPSPSPASYEAQRQAAIAALDSYIGG